MLTPDDGALLGVILLVFLVGYIVFSILLKIIDIIIKNCKF